MTLEQQVTSLELSKKLYNLDVKQESHFYWVEVIQRPDWEPSISSNPDEYLMDDGCGYESFSAFTVAELGEILPVGFWKDGVNYSLRIDGNYVGSRGRENVRRWVVQYRGSSLEKLHTEIEESEADARAKMLVYLLENKLIEL